MRNEALTLPERHLGLVMDHELGDAKGRLDAAAGCTWRVRGLGQMTDDYPAVGLLTFSAW
jgi:cobyrinic acid a,c-diamide synthase